MTSVIKLGILKSFITDRLNPIPTKGRTIAIYSITSKPEGAKKDFRELRLADKSCRAVKLILFSFIKTLIMIKALISKPINRVSKNNQDIVVITDQGDFTFDNVLYATGRKPNIEGLGLENTSIELTERGAIKVDDYCQTSVPSVFAVGDVNGGLQFTYISLDDYRIVNGF